jgi:filamentous hemagglutinin
LFLPVPFAKEGSAIACSIGRTLLAGRDIVNAGDTIIGSDVALVAHGDILNKSLAVKQTYDFGAGGGGSYTSLSNTATIAAIGTLDIMAGGDLTKIATKISAGSANLSTACNIDFGTARSKTPTSKPARTWRWIAAAIRPSIVPPSDSRELSPRSRAT